MAEIPNFATGRIWPIRHDRSPGGLWTYRAETWFDALIALGAFQGSYGIINANVSWENANSRFGAVLGVNNLAGKDCLQLRLVAQEFGYLPPADSAEPLLS